MAALLPILVATLATASPVSTFVTKQALPAVPQGWQYQAPAAADHELQLHIRLREENLDQLQQRLLESSDPDSASYGKHLTKAEVDALTSPTDATIDSVTKWLTSYGIDAGKAESGYLQVNVSVEQAKKLLNADYAVYKDTATGRETIRTTSYSLPKEVFSAISMVQPTTMFSDLGASAKSLQMVQSLSEKRDTQNSTCFNACTNGSVTDCIRADYKVKGYTPSNKTTLGIAGFLGEVPNFDDLARYIAAYTPNLPSTLTIPIISISNGSTIAGGEGEADLDVQIAVPLTYPLKNVYYSTGGSPPINAPPGTPNTNEPYLDWLQYLAGQDSPPQTITVSYGDDETSVPNDYADSVCTQFMKLGARGVTVFVASGDDGAGTIAHCNGTTINEFNPQFPASCPWVTVVGGTQLYGKKEMADRLGGGGFSNHFAMPSWQKDAASKYIKELGGAFDGVYNKSGRAYPDVAASFETYPMFFRGKSVPNGGTSAATPTVASIIAILNDFLVTSGKSPLGFLNPWLYKKGHEGFRDIAKGQNNVCVDRTVTPINFGQDAFPALEGWDAATGWGVPNFEKLKELVA